MIDLTKKPTQIRVGFFVFKSKFLFEGNGENKNIFLI